MYILGMENIFIKKIYIQSPIYCMGKQPPEKRFHKAHISTTCKNSFTYIKSTLAYIQHRELQSCIYLATCIYIYIYSIGHIKSVYRKCIHIFTYSHEKLH